MNSEEMYRLRWESSSSVVDLPTVFQSFRENEELFDVSVGCSISDGGSTSVRAHKVILSAYSPVFKDMFTRLEDRDEPFVYLKGISHNNLLWILDFIYEGSVDIAKSNMKAFLSDAQELQIKGLDMNKESYDTVKEEPNNNITTALSSSIQKHNQSKRLKQEDWINRSTMESAMSNDLINKSFPKAQNSMKIPEIAAKIPKDSFGARNRTIKKETMDHKIAKQVETDFGDTTGLESFVQEMDPAETYDHKDSYIDKGDYIIHGIGSRVKATCKICHSVKRRDNMARHVKACGKMSNSTSHPTIKADTSPVAPYSMNLNDLSQKEEFFEKVEGRYIMAGKEKRAISKCKICGKEVRRDRRNKHLRGSHPKLTNK